ncbi:hypothetical protein OSB04_024772 [Centaurea solstitialis]|uniref:Uncharacterized protein n=1 Tax=Centaurea solstitialis TaxID=347529 RepID=A0AA38SZ26_9ASTR|nr:hypothetical protein OSB04_024772 [Centaurea solstitialis]
MGTYTTCTLCKCGLGIMWLFKQKFNADGSLACYKARLVANGRSQQPDIDVMKSLLQLSNRALYALFLVFQYLDVGLCINWISRIPFFTFIYGRLSTCISLQVFMTIDFLIMYATNNSTLVYCIPTTRRSTLVTTFFLGRQNARIHVISRSSVEAEYRGVANVVAETCWVCNLLYELHCPPTKRMVLYCDKYADIFTKGIPSSLFNEFKSYLNIQNSPLNKTVGGC